MSIRRRIMGEMVAVLGDTPALDEPHGRRQWRRELSESFDTLELEPFPTPRQEFVEAVRACCARPGGLDVLLDVTRFVANTAVPRLEPLVDEYHAAELFDARDWTALRQALDITLPELHAVVAEVCGDRVRLPAHCATAWRAFTHLACANAAPGELLPSMVLLEHLARHTELASSVGELLAWNEHFADEWGLREGANGLDALRATLAQGQRDGAGRPGGGHPAGFRDAASEPPVIRLFVMVAPDLTPVDARGRRQGRRETRYRLSSRVRYAESAGLHREPDSELRELVPRSRVPVAVAELLNRMSELWQSRAEEVVLEFFLPTELLNEPVEWWNRNPALGYANPLLSKYHEILLHSLERLRRPDLHHAWRLRWARWKNSPDQVDVHWCEPAGRPADEHLSQLDAQIGKRDEVAAMVLSEPPRTRPGLGLRELRLGLDLGVPVLIHHREDSASPAFRSLLREGLSEGGLAKLPARTRQWKGDCAVAGSSASEDPVRHLSLIWDNPEQLLDGGPCAPATFIGGIE